MHILTSIVQIAISIQSCAFNNIYYKIKIINDYRCISVYVDWKTLGNGHLVSEDESVVRWKYRGYVLSSDCIQIQLNYNTPVSFKDKSSAKAYLSKLLKDAPKESLKCFESCASLLLSVIE